MKGSTTIERRGTSAGAREATATGRFALRNHHAPPPIRISSAASAATSGRAPNPFFLRGRPGGHCGLCLRGRADLKRIDPDWLGYVLELDRADVGDREIEPPLHLPVGLLGETKSAGLGNALQARAAMLTPSATTSGALKLQ